MHPLIIDSSIPVKRSLQYLYTNALSLQYTKPQIAQIWHDISHLIVLGDTWLSLYILYSRMSLSKHNQSINDFTCIRFDGVLFYFIRICLHLEVTNSLRNFYYDTLRVRLARKHLVWIIYRPFPLSLQDSVDLIDHIQDTFESVKLSYFLLLGDHNAPDIERKTSTNSGFPPALLNIILENGWKQYVYFTFRCR